MTITAAEDNVIHELASRPAIERLSEAIASLDRARAGADARGVMLGLVIDENKPEYLRGDFLIRPIIGADQEAGTIAIGEPVRVGQTVRLHVRDEGVRGRGPARGARDARRALASQPAPPGALLFTCNGRGSHMFSVPDHDAAAVEDALGAPAGGFFCAGEIGPVGGATSSTGSPRRWRSPVFPPGHY